MTSLPLVLVRSERERKSHFVRWSFLPLQLPLVGAAIKRSFLPSVYLDPHAGCRWRLDLSDSDHSMIFLGYGDGYNRFKRICLQRIWKGRISFLFSLLRSDPIDLPAPAERENQARLAYCLINEMLRLSAQLVTPTLCLRQTSLCHLFSARLTLIW